MPHPTPPHPIISIAPTPSASPPHHQRSIKTFSKFTRTLASPTPPHPTPPHHQRSIKTFSKFTRTLTSPTPPHPTPPHHQRSIKTFSKFTRTLTSPTPPHPNPPHHQRSIKNLRREKIAFRDLSFRSVGKNIISNRNPILHGKSPRVCHGFPVETPHPSPQTSPPPPQSTTILRGDTGVPERFIGCVLGTAQGPRSLIFRSLEKNPLTPMVWVYKHVAPQLDS